MLGLNHALTGILIARSLPLPVAIPVAIASHFVLDIVPHYGIPNATRDHTKFWKVYVSADTTIAISLVFVAIATHDLPMLLGGVAATAPDYIWVARVLKTKSYDLSHNNNWFTRWHVNIQGLERPWGIWIEIPITVI